jgi:2-C-methyl-D-erythritol 4-phosphate cytidylyltransferase
MALFEKSGGIPKTAAVIAAAGGSRRMGFDKLTCDLGGAPVILHTLTAFERCDAIHEVVLVAREEYIAQLLDMANACGLQKLRSIVRGGQTRQLSVWAGVCACSQDVELVCIHDGARPLVGSRVIADAVSAAARYGAAAAAVALKDTVKYNDNGFAAGTPDRSRLVAVQTPQVFSRALYLRAYEAARQEYSDDCQLIEAIGGRVAFSKGDYRNIKLTTPEDFAAAQAMLEWGDPT